MIILISVLWVPVSCERHSDGKKQQESEAEEKRTDQAIMRLAESHNAVADWRQPFLNGSSRLTGVYTAELASALVRQDGRPILFIGDLRDVERDGDKFRLYFLTGIDTTEALIILDATQSQAAQVMAPSEDGLNSWAVVAQVDSVRSLALQTILVPENDKSAPPQSAVYGRCLDLLDVGLYRPEQTRHP